jgi:hypothetical protein
MWCEISIFLVCSTLEALLISAVRCTLHLLTITTLIVAVATVAIAVEFSQAVDLLVVAR